MKRKILITACMALCVLTGAASQPLKRAYEEFPLGSIKGEGWLGYMLRSQMEGISRNMDRDYSQVCGERNGWLGGDGDQWERGPYWIDGLLPLAYILDDKEAKEKVQAWVEWTLQSQDETGFFGPKKDYTPERGVQRTNARDWWPRMVVLKILMQYHNATGDSRVLSFMDRYFRFQLRELPVSALDRWTNWAAFRRADNMIAALWLYGKTGEEYLLSLCEMLHETGYDFTSRFLSGEIFSRMGTIHGVNLAQGLKEPVIYWQMHPEQRYLDAMDKCLEDMRIRCGYPNGMFSGDETIRDNNPTQGIELCSVVEMMYSMEEMLKATGRRQYAEHLERIAFNALPCQITPDFRFHQYYQQVNQINLSAGGHNFDCNDAAMQTVFGTLCAYPCCYTNQHQGWPKFTQNLWLRSPDGGVAAMYYSPCRLCATISGEKVTLTERTAYPFSPRIEIEISIPNSRGVGFPIHLGIPSWCREAKVTCKGQTRTGSGEFVLEHEWRDSDRIILEFPMHTAVSRWHQNAATVEHGPLVYALRIEEKWEEIKLDPALRKGESYWQVTPQSPWNYALLQNDVAKAEQCFIVERDELKTEKALQGAWIWSAEESPLRIRCRGARIPQWKMYNSDTGPMPYSQVPAGRFSVNNMRSAFQSDGEYQELELVPYGCTTLRITEFPVISK